MKGNPNEPLRYLHELGNSPAVLETMRLATVVSPCNRIPVRVLDDLPPLVEVEELPDRERDELAVIIAARVIFAALYADSVLALDMVPTFSRGYTADTTFQ